jgi:hypothetical protein
MYNNAVTTGWGLWVNPERLLHFKINDKAWNLKESDKLINKDPYKIVIDYSHRVGYTFTLINLKYFSEEGKKRSCN